MEISRRAGSGWLVLIGGGDFSFGETEDADRAWIARSASEGRGPVGFVPAASGSTDYGNHFAVYLDEIFERKVETVPIYRARDARRGKNVSRLDAAADIYLGGGVCDHLLDALQGSPCLEAIERKLDSGGNVIAIAAAAQTLGAAVRSLFGGKIVEGLGWLPGGALETNFDPGHDRRLRQLLEAPGIHWGLGLPAGSALLLGPAGEREAVGTIFTLEGPDADLGVWQP